MHTPSAPAPAGAATTSPLWKLSQLPATGFVRQKQLLQALPFSRSTLWRRVRNRTFPQPGKLSARITVWWAEDIHAWAMDEASAAFDLPADREDRALGRGRSRPH